MRTLALTLLVVIIVLSGACGTSLVTVPLPELDEVIEALGYGLAPTHLPEGFEFHQYEVLVYGKPDEVVLLDKLPATIVYRKLNHHIFVMYPQRLPSSGGDDFLLERLGLDWQRPDDAVSEVKVNGETAYLVRGNWSYETLEQLARPDPEVLAEYVPEWDYEVQLNLYFNFYLSQDEVVEVRILALTLPQPVDWITAKEMVAIAGSLQRVD